MARGVPSGHRYYTVAGYKNWKRWAFNYALGSKDPLGQYTAFLREDHRGDNDRTTSPLGGQVGDRQDYHSGPRRTFPTIVSARDWTRIGR